MLSSTDVDLSQTDKIDVVIAQKALVVTLPLSDKNSVGRVCVVRVLQDDKGVRVVPSGHDNIEGLAQPFFVAFMQARTFIADGKSNWWVIADHNPG